VRVAEGAVDERATLAARGSNAQQPQVGVERVRQFFGLREKLKACGFIVHQQ
jgi:hypothetical protein